MKKVLSSIIAAIVVCAASAVVAGNVYDRDTKTITSTGKWTNTVQYAAIELKRIWISGNTATSGTVTVQRITSDGTYTQTVGSVTCTTGAGSTTSFTAAYLKPSDMLLFTEGAGSNATAMIEFEVQKH